uniref:NADH dehydrogenase [ubiquinone] 1 beta subcomplex subunit 1 n=1 Tax=Anopheles atroparvus TaxID=41427 RepID=A0AAG5DC25_ANOAO
MVFGITRQYLWSVVPLFGFSLGWFLDSKETERMTMFRDKSALYGRVLKEGEKPSWP